MKLFYPVKPWDGGQPFGEKDIAYTKMGLLGHNGVDEPCPVGTPVCAAHNGTISWTNTNDTAGNFIALISEDNTFQTFYLHLSKFNVVPGQKVSVGDIIGFSGNTGFSTGPHLHFMLKFVRVDGGEVIDLDKNNGYRGAVDPKQYFTGEYAADQKIIPLQQQMVEVLKKLIKLLSKK